MVKRPRWRRVRDSRRMLTTALALLVVLLGLSWTLPALAQDLSGRITLDVDAGFETYFREDYWIPLRIHVSNAGSDIVGRLVVRPETSGSGLLNTFSLPISLPTGADKTPLLYIAARNFTQQVRVELLDDSGQVYTSTDAPIRSIQPTDQLYVVITQSAAGSVDLTNVTVGGYRSFQANWQIANVPERSGALDAVNIMLVSDVDTGTLTSGQAQAVADWVAHGGHLIVTGGQNWQATSAMLKDLLPLVPTNSMTIENLSALAAMAGDNQPLEGETIISTGDLLSDAQVLAATAEGVPLVARHAYGAGTVDYLTADPGAQLLRQWPGIRGLWFSLISTVRPLPSWLRNFGDWDSAIDALENLPGANLVLPLCGFLGLYIVLVGPVNYLILSRVNRREWAWVSIPGLIILFSVMSWVFGSNLRGTDVTLNRLTIVQSWPTAERARVDQVVGLLSPLRANYTLSVTDGRLLRPIQRSGRGGLFGGGPIQSNIDIRQTDLFAANDFTVDTSFVAAFNTTGVMAKPAISGQATLAFEEDGRVQKVRGSVRNDSDQTLNDPVILMRGVTLRLNAPIEPGDLKTFDGDLAGDGVPQAGALEPSFDPATTAFGFRYASRFDQEISLKDVLGVDTYRELQVKSALDDQQQMLRRQQFLQSFMADRFNSTGRGERVFLAGWTDTPPVEFEVEGARSNVRDTTLYIIELALEIDSPPANRAVTISEDQFSWITESRAGITMYSGPLYLRLQPGDEVVFRFAPLPEMILSQVDQLVLKFERGGGFVREIPIQLWYWRAGRWVDIGGNNSTVTIDNPQSFIGPQNVVRVRLFLEGGSTSFIDVGNVSIEQKGRF